MFATDNPTRLTAPSPFQGEGWGGVLYIHVLYSFFKLVLFSRYNTFSLDKIAIKNLFDNDN